MSLYIISGPSQAGKTTLANLLLKDKAITKIVTSTSRKPRLGEKNGIDYYFLSEKEFNDKSKFIEIANVHGNYYGISGKEVEDKLKSGKKVILVIDVQGVNTILKDYNNLPKETVTIFLVPDKLSILLERIKAKNDPNVDERIKSIKKELEYLNLFKYIINTSKSIEESLEDLEAIIYNDKEKIKEILGFTKKFNVKTFLEN